MDTLIQKLEVAKTTSDDLPVWEAIRKELLPVAGKADESDIEEAFLSNSPEFHDDDNPFPDKLPSDLCANQIDMDHFVHSVFERRYGWSEADQNDNLLKGKDLRKRENSHSNAQKKTRINERMDEFLKWFLFEKKYSRMLASLKYTIGQAQNKPVVRSQTVIHTMDWLRCVVMHIPHEHHDNVQDVIVIGLTDIWSAIRNACVSRLSHVIEHFSLLQLQDFFNALVKICVNNESSWQSKEGAIMGINSLVRRFQWIGFLTDEDGSDSSSRTEFFLRFGNEELKAMPEFISSRMHEVIFGLLAHPQLTVRENATKAYSSYISKCESKEAQSSFNEVVQQLRRVFPANSQPSLEVLSHNDFTFMDAYEADGLLQVCVHLVKHIPPGHLLPEWPKYFSTFALYLMHPASTVRLSTSAIFKFLIARDSGNPILLKLILQGLCKGWITDNIFLGAAQGANNCSYGGVSVRKSVMSVIQAKENDFSCAWEWREGRLLAYELIFQFLIKNHWLYTFGSSQLTTIGPPSSPRLDASRGKADTSRNPKLSTSYGSPNIHPPVKASVSSSGCGGKDDRPNLDSVLESEGESGRKSPVFCMPVRRNSLSATPGAWDIPSHRGNKHHGKLDKVDELPALPTPAQYARLNRPRHSISITVPTEESPDRVPISKAKRLAYTQHRTLTQASSSAGAAEFSTQRLFTRLPTITGYTDQPSLRTLVRHYSYYTKPNTSPLIGPTTSKAASLLMHSLALDMPPSKDGQSLSDDRCDSPLLPGSPRGNKQTEWFKEVVLENMSAILEDVLYQAIESMADVRWELRRMGQQLMPCVVEVIRWYDMKILERLWEKNLSGAPTLLTYGSCLALRHSLSHAARLQAMLHDPPLTWQDPDLCRHIILRITESIKHNLKSWIEHVHRILDRRVFDRLAAVAMETLLIAHTHFTLDVDMKRKHIQTIQELLCAIFVKVHPEEKNLVKTISFNPQSNYTVICEGFLCCSARSDGSPGFHNKQMEKHILSEVLPLFSRFLKFSPAISASGLLPMLIFYLRCYSEEDNLSKTLIDSISTLIQQCNTRAVNTSNSDDEVFRHALNALDQLATVLTDKTVDLQTSKQVMDFYLQLATPIPFSKHADLILRALSARMIQTNVPLSSPRTVNGNHGDLALRSNNIPVQQTNGDAGNLSSEEEDPLDLAADVLMQESQSLNVSGNSTSSARHSVGSVDAHQVKLASVDSDEGSDWDDWSDEEEDQSAFTDAFSEFFSNLKAQIETPENLLDFQKTLASLPVKERKHIEAML